jgi:hypothetical protein
LSEESQATTPGAHARKKDFIRGGTAARKKVARPGSQTGSKLKLPKKVDESLRKRGIELEKEP